jgi:2,4-dienoyl-CoA reductase-like NADH-dependent reductase (Old Yellow Enzyme family)
MNELDTLLKPLTIRTKRIRNRIMSTAHAPAYVRDGLPQEQYQRYHEEKARGGIGLTIFGGSSIVSVDSPATFGQIDLSNDRVIPYLHSLADRVHTHGALTWCQITHMGRRTRWDVGSWLAPVSPSPVREPEHRSFPRPMEEWDFVRIKQDFVDATLRCREGGLDGVELSYASSHLIAQFWSPGINLRRDQHGGALNQRMAFSMEILKAIRVAVGADFIVGVRVSGDELMADGLSAKECLTIATIIGRSGLADYLNVLGGSARDFRVGAATMANMSFPAALYLPLASAIRAQVDIPVFHAGRINDLASAARAVAEGHCDMVGMTRGHMADPYLVRKLMDGRLDDVRECVGANYCADRIYMGGQLLCIQNAATGRETTMPHVITPSTGPRRKVVVVGAGPGGLEAARVAAARGHKVVLFESELRTGGQINLAARAPWRGSLLGIVRWLENQVRKLGVELRLGATAATTDVLAELPDIVVLASGGTPNKGRIKGAEHVLTTWDVLSGVTESAETVLVFDDHGGHQAPSCAEQMAGRGTRVELVTPDRYLGAEMGTTNFPVHLRELYRLGVAITPDRRLIEVYPDGNKLIAVLQNLYTLAEEKRVVDQVVAEHGTLPRTDLYQTLRAHSANLGEIDLVAMSENRPPAVWRNPEGRFQLYRVGDALASRNIHAAIYDSLRLAKDF